MRSDADLTLTSTARRHKRRALRAAVLGATVLLAATGAPLGAFAASDTVAPQATSVVERLLSRQMGPLGRDLIAMAADVPR